MQSWATTFQCVLRKKASGVPGENIDMKQHKLLSGSRVVSMLR
jgi:hypothetical protein